MHQIFGTTKILGVMGDPVSHSLSPVMHNAAIAELGLDYVYVPLPVAIADLEIAVNGLKAIAAVAGFNLTIPHKQEIIPFLDEVSDIAKAIGAVNTVKRVGSSWVGTNTDVAGFLVPLQILGLDFSKIPAVILGNGGAAKAVVAGCWQLGCPNLHVVGRDVDKLQKFYSQMTNQQLNYQSNYNLQIHSWSALEDLLKIGGLIINTTPMGMGKDLQTPLTQAQIDLLPKQAIAYDLIYTPRPTKFLQMAAAKGLTTIDGLKMLLHQGAIALEFWTERSAPIQIMEQSLLESLLQSY